MLPGGSIKPPHNHTGGLADHAALRELVSVATLDLHAARGVLPPRTLRLRPEAAGRLATASRTLPDGFALVVLDAWRSSADQQALAAAACPSTRRVGRVATVRPSHRTGGAVDVTLAYHGHALALGSDVGEVSARSALRAFEARDSAMRRLRRLLAATLGAAGFVPREARWWHWSFGDDAWSAARGCPTIYDVWDPDSR